MDYMSWFIPICIAVSCLFAVFTIWLTIATLRFRSKVIRKYDRRKVSG
ncbi:MULTISPECIES: hypothetical protein [Paenibacillus]|uniref:Uncharacterized protein n=1 Tax=Paenibacillus amylolyticus TaxID=1451 RepID=A0A117I2T2_PAEAM|nr:MULTISPECIES: hypothetical protein [Paenibacillus]GAS84244.1 unknown protein [Paenibacillus amylolyticus]